MWCNFHINENFSDYYYTNFSLLRLLENYPSFQSDCIWSFGSQLPHDYRCFLKAVMSKLLLVLFASFFNLDFNKINILSFYIQIGLIITFSDLLLLKRVLI